MLQNRICRKCGIAFASHRCESCHRASSAAYRANNHDKVIAAGRAHCAANRESERLRVAAYVAANREKVRLSKASYSARNSEAAVARVKEWRKKNPLAQRIQGHNRRAKQRENGGSLTKGLSVKLFQLQRGKCACCGMSLGDDYQLDHIMPIALGGANEDWNIQLLRKTCNRQKSAKHPVVFMQERGMLL